MLGEDKTFAVMCMYVTYLEIANLFAEITGKEPENKFLDEIQNSKTFSRR
jgi:hypothetical protein